MAKTTTAEVAAPNPSTNLAISNVEIVGAHTHPIAPIIKIALPIGTVNKLDF